jgi:enoyl-CoA hydratase/carnithine racemase
MSNFETIIYEKKDKIVSITLNRPDQLNALSPDVYRELYQACEDIEADDDIRVIIFKGEGKAFCAGADLKAMQPSLEKASLCVKYLEMCHRTYNQIENLTKPTIAQVHGMCLAGGIELIESCDIIIACESARIGDQHAARGLVPGGGGTQRLIRQMNFRKAKEILLTGAWMSAAEAYEWGFINKVVPDDQLEQAVMEMAEKLAKQSPMCSKTIKWLCNKGIQADLTTALRMEIASTAQHAFTDDFREGIASFMERRKPEFKGL